MNILLIIGGLLYCLIFYLIGREDEKIRQAKMRIAELKKKIKMKNTIMRKGGNPRSVLKAGNHFVIGGKRYDINYEGIKAYGREDWVYFENLIKEAE